MLTARAQEFFVSGGTLPLESASYVERDSDAALFRALTAGKYCYVLNSRQMGKSSLSVRTIAKLEREGCCAVAIDLTQMGGRNVTADQWYIGMAAELGRTLGLRSEILKYWRENESFSSVQRFFGCLRDVILKTIEQPIVIFIDEIDATRNLAFETDEFFAGIRECFNRRARDASYNRLTFCVLGVAVPSDLIRNPNTTPFNIGERIYLRDFTAQEMSAFAPALGDRGKDLVSRVHYWTSGHPYLSQSLCAKIATDGIATPEGVDELVHQELFAPKSRERNINLADVANRALNSGANEADPERFRSDLVTTYERILKDSFVPDDEANRVVVLLKLCGLVRSDGRRLIVRNRIYAHVFDRVWIRENMPGQELLRQQQSYRRGLFRATAVYAVVLVTVGALGLLAWQSQSAAIAAREALDRELYFADMTNLRVFEQTGDIARIAETLERTKNSRYRGFEWGYWQTRLHDSPEEYTLDYFAPGKRETGYLSWDGRLACVVDDLTQTATVIDRSTRRKSLVHSLKLGESVVDSRFGFRVLDVRQTEQGKPVRIYDLLTGMETAHINADFQRPALVITRPGSNCIGVRTYIRTPNLKSNEKDTLHPGLQDQLSIYDLDTGKKVGDIPFRHRVVSPDRTLFSQDGTVAAYVTRPSEEAPPSDRNPVLEVYDVVKGTVIDRVKLPPTGDLLALSDSGKSVLYGEDGARVYGRDIPTHRNVYRRDWPRGEVATSACFVGGDSILSTLDRTGRLTIEDFPQGRTIGTRYNVWSISPVHDKASIVANATSVRVFPARADTEAKIFVKGNRLGRDGRGNIVVWDDAGILRVNDQTLAETSRSPRPARLGSYTYNGRWVTFHDGAGNTYCRDPLGDKPAVKLAFNPINFSGGNSPDFIAAFKFGEDCVYGINAATGQILWKTSFTGRGRGIWVSPDSKSVLCFVGEAAVQVYDAKTGQLRGTLERHNLHVNNLTFCEDGKSFFTCGSDGRAILWDLATLEEKMEFQGSPAIRIGNADLSPDGKRVVTATDAGVWQLWDAKTGVQLAEVKATQNGLRQVLFTVDGSRILAACDDKTIRIWESNAIDRSIHVPVNAFGLRNIKR